MLGIQEDNPTQLGNAQNKNECFSKETEGVDLPPDAGEPEGPINKVGGNPGSMFRGEDKRLRRRFIDAAPAEEICGESLCRADDITRFAGGSPRLKRWGVQSR